MANNLKITAEFDSTKASAGVSKLSNEFKKLGSEAKKSNDKVNLLSKEFVAYTAHLGQGLVTFGTIGIETGKIISRFANSFINLNAEQEKLKKNIASLISLNSSNVTSTGRILSLQDKFTLSLKESAKTLESFTKLSQKSGYAVNDLSAIFQSFYSGASKSLSFKQATESFENLIQTLKISGIETNQLKATIDGLGSGAVLASSDLGRFLRQIGLSNEALKEAIKSGDLYNLIMSKTSENVKVANLSLGSYEDNLSLMRGNINELKIALSKPIFEKLNESLASANKFFEENKESLTAITQKVAELTPLLLKLGGAFLAFKAYTKIAPLILGGFTALKNDIIATNTALIATNAKIGITTSKAVLMGNTFKAVGNLMAKSLKSPLVALTAIIGAMDSINSKWNAFDNALKPLDFKALDFKDKEQILREIKEVEDAIKSLQNIKNVEVAGFTSGLKSDFLASIDKKIGTDMNSWLEKSARFTAETLGFTDKAQKNMAKNAVEAQRTIVLLQDKLVSLKSALNENKDPLEKVEELVSNLGETSVSVAKNQKDLTKFLNEQALALKEIAKIGLSDYELGLESINEQLERYKKLGIDSKKIRQVRESLTIKLDLEKSERDFEEAKALMIEFYESIGNKQEAWALKEVEVRAKFAEAVENSLISKEDLEKLVKAQKEAYFQVEKNAKKSLDEIESHYLEMIKNMQKSIESSFFDLINDKINNLKDLFKDLGRTILQDFLSPYIKSLSGFLSNAGAGALGLLMPSFGGGATQKNETKAFNAVIDFAKEQGLKYDESIKAYSGIIKGQEVVIDNLGNVNKGSEALNNVSNIISGANSIQGIVSGEWLDTATSAFESVTSFFNSGGGAEVSFKDALTSNNFSDFLSGSGSEIASSVESSSVSIVDSVGNGFNSLFDTLGNYVNQIGTFGGSIINLGTSYLASITGSSSLAMFSGGAALANGGIAGIGTAFGGGLSSGLGFLAGTAGNMLVGGGLGYGIGSLGDMLFGADTHAGTAGAIGGAIGSLILPGIGTLLGSALGSIFGGLFGKKKVTGSGIYLGDNIDFGEYFNKQNLQTYVSYKKKSWFSSKSWNEYQGVSDSKLKELNLYLENQFSTLERLRANLDKFELVAGHYGGNSLFEKHTPDALIKAFLNTNNNSEINAQIAEIERVASENGIKYAQQVANQFSDFMQLQTKALANIYKGDIVKVARLNLDDIMYSLKVSMRNVNGGFEAFGLNEKTFTDLGQLSATAFNKAMNESLRNDFTPQNLETWKNLSEAFDKANEAVKNLLNSIITQTTELKNITAGFLEANDIKSSAPAMQILLTQYETLMAGLKNDLNANEKGIFADVFTANDKLLNLGEKGLNDFLSSGDTELRKQLVQTLTQIQATMTNQNGLLFATDTMLKLAEVDKLIAKTEPKENAKNEIAKNNKSISALTDKLNLLSSFANLSNSLINTALNNGDNITQNYKALLEQAQADFKAGNLNSVSFSNLQNSANVRANELKNSVSDYATYQLEMLKMANELKDLGGEADLNSIQEMLKKLNEQNAELNKALEETIKDTANMNLEELKAYREELVKQGEMERENFNKYFGEQSPVAKYLAQLLEQVKKGELNAGELNIYAKLENANIQQDINNKLNFKPFADGGIVTAPTRALIGENGYPEAVIPLKNGRGLKVDFSEGFDNLSDKLSRGFANLAEALNYGFNELKNQLKNVDNSVKYGNMDLNIISRQTREIAESVME